MDVYTLAWFRFLAAGALLTPLLAYRQGLRSLLAVRKAPGLMVVCIIGLCGNYLIYMSSLKFVSPGAAQVVIQLSPTFVMVGGFLIFKERFVRLQWLGFVILVLGMALFFNQRYETFLNGGSVYLWGILLVVAAAVFWAIYILAQKQLQTVMFPEAILLIIYMISMLVILPIAQPTTLTNLGTTQWVLLVVVSVMTVVSYVCFGMALNHLEASRSGIIVAVTPLITVGMSNLAVSFFPLSIEIEPLNAIGFSGAILVVIGSALGALSRSHTIRPNTANANLKTATPTSQKEPITTI